MVTRVVAKQAKTTKVKNKFVNGKKKFKRILTCLSGGRGKVQFRRKKLGIKFRRKGQICLVGSVANSVGTPLEFAAFRSRASAFWFFVHNHGFCGGPNTFCQEKHQHFYVVGSLSSRKKEISSKINNLG